VIKIEVKDLNVEQRQAKGYTFRTQNGWTELNGERRKVPLSLENGQMPYELGSYVLGDGSFYIGDFGRLMIGRLELQRVAAAAPGVRSAGV
jgi:hypothetical protein